MEDTLKSNNLRQVESSPSQSTPNEPNISHEDLDSRWLRWKCLVCGYLYEGVRELKICPKCGNQDPDRFEDTE